MANSFAIHEVEKMENRHTLFKQLEKQFSQDSDDYLMDTDEGVEDKRLPYFRIPNFLILLKKSLLPDTIKRIL